jgi:hypothetical protein
MLKRRSRTNPGCRRTWNGKIGSVGLKWKLACVIPTVLPSARDPRCSGGREAHGVRQRGVAFCRPRGIISAFMQEKPLRAGDEKWKWNVNSNPVAGRRNLESCGRRQDANRGRGRHCATARHQRFDLEGGERRRKTAPRGQCLLTPAQ